MPGDRNFMGLLASHWHDITKKHKDPSTKLRFKAQENLSENQKEVGFELHLWTMCFEICQKTHAESLPCLTMADFNAFLTSHTQNFVTKGCGALAFYNKVFGKQDLNILLKKKTGKNSSTAKKNVSLYLAQLTLMSSEVGSFLDDAFILKAAGSVSQFLEKDFTNPLSLASCNSSRIREAHSAIKNYISDVDYSCLCIPSFLRKVKFTLEVVEELKGLVYFESSLTVRNNVKDDVDSVVRDSLNIRQTVVQLMGLIESGNELIVTLTIWGHYESELADACSILRRRHNELIETSPFNDMQLLKNLGDYLWSSSRALSRAIEELEEVLSLSYAPLSDTFSVISAQSSRGRLLFADLSRGNVHTR